LEHDATKSTRHVTASARTAFIVSDLLDVVGVLDTEQAEVVE
jgi:hypothetical protein